MPREYKDPFEPGKEVYAFRASQDGKVWLDRPIYVRRDKMRCVYKYADDAKSTRADYNGIELKENGVGDYCDRMVEALGRFIDRTVPSAFSRRQKIDHVKIARTILDAVTLYQNTIKDDFRINVLTGIADDLETAARQARMLIRGMSLVERNPDPEVNPHQDA